MKKTGVIFDVDGTLLNTMPVWTDSGVRYLASLGIEAESNLGEKLFAMTVDGGAVYLKENYHLQSSVEEIKRGILSMVERAYFESADFKPGAKELLEYLKEKEIPMSIATSTDRYCIIAAFDRLGYTEYFDAILSCGEFDTTKSEPKIFYEAIKVMGTDAENTWIFEDGLYSIKTGKAAGFKVVGVYDEVSKNDQKEIEQCADIYVKNLTELKLI